MAKVNILSVNKEMSNAREYVDISHMYMYSFANILNQVYHFATLGFNAVEDYYK